MTPGGWLHFPLYGEDSNGDTWSGHLTWAGLAGQWVNGVWTIPTVSNLVLTHEASGGTIEYSRTLYLDQYGSEVMLTLNKGVGCYPQVTNNIPHFAQDGDYGDLGIMVCSDGSELHGIWDLYSNPDLSADYVTLSTV